jgi:hypothetical protein
MVKVWTDDIQTHSQSVRDIIRSVRPSSSKASPAEKPTLHTYFTNGFFAMLHAQIDLLIYCKSFHFLRWNTRADEKTTYPTWVTLIDFRANNSPPQKMQHGLDYLDLSLNYLATLIQLHGPCTYRVVQKAVNWLLHTNIRCTRLYYLPDLQNLSEIRSSMLKAQLTTLWYRFINWLEYLCTGIKIPLSKIWTILYLTGYFDI